MKKLLCALFVILLISSCNKAKFNDDYVCLENCIVFSGQIIDTPFNNNLSGVELKFYYHSLEGSSFLRPPVYLGTKTTGEDGTYSFKFNGEEYLKQGYFSIEGKKSGYFAHPTTSEDFETYGSIRVEDIKQNTPIVHNINLYKKALLELKIRSENRPDFNTFHVYYGTTKQSDGGGFDHKKGYSTGFNILFEDKIDTLININIPVGIQSYIHWQGYNYLEPFIINEIDSLISQDGEKAFYEIVL